MATMRALGEIQHEDNDATYYPGVETIGTRESFGVYQYATFEDPTTGKIMVGKPHSFWYCKHDRELQLEIQPFPYTNAQHRCKLGEDTSEVIELDMQTDTIEIPASALRRRILTNVAYVPPRITEANMAEFVRNAPLEYSDQDLGVCCDDEGFDEEDHHPEDGDDKEEDDDFIEDDATTPHLFFFRSMRVAGNGRRKKRVLAMPPKFVDGWMSFCAQKFTAVKPYWEHEFASFVLENYLRPLFLQLDPDQDVEKTFYAIETRAYEFNECTSKTSLTDEDEPGQGRVRKKRGGTIRWFPKSPKKALDSAQVSTLDTVETFLSELIELKDKHADHTEVFQRCAVLA